MKKLYNCSIWLPWECQDCGAERGNLRWAQGTTWAEETDLRVWGDQSSYSSQNRVLERSEWNRRGTLELLSRCPLSVREYSSARGCEETTADWEKNHPKRILRDRAHIQTRPWMVLVHITCDSWGFWKCTWKDLASVVWNN